jgi:hypothetical protein
LKTYQAHEVCLDTSTYLLPCDSIPDDNTHAEKVRDQKAMLIIKKLVEDGKVKLFIPANVHFELRKHSRRFKANEFWKQVKVQTIPQEIGFDGIQRSVGRSSEYQETIAIKEKELTGINDKSLDSSIILNSWFFGKTIVTSDYKRIKRIKKIKGVRKSF